MAATGGDSIAKIFARKRHQVALSEALRMPLWAACATSSQVAVMVIKTDQSKQQNQNHVSDCILLMFYSCPV